MWFSFDERALIHKAIQDGDYRTFIEYYIQYGEEFFPKTATIYANQKNIGKIEIYTPEGFALIKEDEGECG